MANITESPVTAQCRKTSVKQNILPSIFVHPPFRSIAKYAQCLKLRGYSFGDHPEGFTEMETSDPAQIGATLRDDCQVQSDGM